MPTYSPSSTAFAQSTLQKQRRMIANTNPGAGTSKACLLMHAHKATVPREYALLHSWSLQCAAVDISQQD